MGAFPLRTRPMLPKARRTEWTCVEPREEKRLPVPMETKRSPSADFASRAARRTIEQARRPSLLRRAWEAPRRLAAAAWPGWMRPALGTAGLVGVFGGAAATAVGTLIHATRASNPWQGTFTLPSSVAQARYWDSVLPHLPLGDGTALSRGVPPDLALAIPLLLAFATLLCCDFLLRASAVVSFLRLPSPASDRSALLGPASRTALGVLLAGVVVATPLLLFYALDLTLVASLVDIHQVLQLAGVMMLLWGGVVTLLSGAGLLARAVRGIPASTTVFVGCWAVGITLEGSARHLLELSNGEMFPHDTWFPASATEIEGLAGLLSVVLSPSELVREACLGAMALGLLAGTLLGVVLAWHGPTRTGGGPATPRASRESPGLRLVSTGSFLLVALWAWHLHGFLDQRHLFERPLASMLPTQGLQDVARTGIVLLPTSRPASVVGTAGAPGSTPTGATPGSAGTGVTAGVAGTAGSTAPRPVGVVPYPVPGELVAAMALPQFAESLDGRFGFDTPGAYRMALTRATLDWDTENVDELFARYTQRVPGIHQGIVHASKRLKTAIRWTYPPGSDPVSERGDTWVGGTERFRRRREICEQAGLALDTQGARPPTGGIRGRLLVDGKAAAGLRVRLMLAPPISIRADQANEIRDRLARDTSNTLATEVRVARFTVRERSIIRDVVTLPDLWAVPTDARGDFHFEDVPPGRHALAVLLPRTAREVQARGHADLVLVGAGVTDVGTVDLITERKGE